MFHDEYDWAQLPKKIVSYVKLLQNILERYNSVYVVRNCTSPNDDAY